MKICITGGSGFLGGHLVDRCISEGHEVYIFDNLSRSTQHNSRAVLIKGDMTIKEDVEKIPPVDVIIHTAAICGTTTAVMKVAEVLADFNGTQNLTRHAIKIGVKKFVYFSSSEIYGDSVLQVHEFDYIKCWNAHEPRAAYTYSKLSSESLVNTLPIATVIIRPFNIYGPRQIGFGVIRNFIESALRKKPIEVYNSGNEIRAMCHVDDFIEGVYRAATYPLKEQHAVFNIGNPSSATTIVHLANLIKKVTKSESSIVHKTVTATDKIGVTPCIDKAKKELNFEPKIGLEEGIHSLIPWYTEYIKTVKESK